MGLSKEFDFAWLLKFLNIGKIRFLISSLYLFFSFMEKKIVNF